MVHETLHKARNWFLNYKDLSTAQGIQIPFFWTKYNHQGWNFGDRILFQHIKPGKGQSSLISRPIYAIFVGWSVWDQALVMHFVENRRAWMNSSSVEIKYNNKEYEPMSVYMHDMEVQHIQFWTDNIKVLGHWDYKPELKELKTALNGKI